MLYKFSGSTDERIILRLYILTLLLLIEEAGLFKAQNAKKMKFLTRLILSKQNFASIIAFIELLLAKATKTDAIIAYIIYYIILITPNISKGQTSEIGAPASIICLKSSIAGFDNEHKTAKALLPDLVVNESDMTVYITRKDGFLYLHSNYKPNSSIEYSVKISTNESNDLRYIIDNIYSAGGQFQTDFNLKHAYENDVTLVFDRSMFDSEGAITMDIGEKISNHLYANFTDSPPPKKIRQITSKRGPPNWMAEWESSVFTKINTSYSPDYILERLDSKSFDLNGFRLVSLFIDGPVERRLASSSIRKNIVVLQEISEDELEKVFASTDVKTIALLGHVEDGFFVTRSPDGKEIILKISLDKIKEFEKKYRKDVFYLGCNSYQSVGLGVDRVFNPLFAIGKIENAVNSKTAGDFIRKFTSNQLAIVLDESAFANTSSQQELAEVVGFKIVKKDRPRRNADYTIGDDVGFITFTFGSENPSISPEQGSKENIVYSSATSLTDSSQIYESSPTNYSPSIHENKGDPESFKMNLVIMACSILLLALFITFLQDHIKHKL